jgi:glutathione S-transferase
MIIYGDKRSGNCLKIKYLADHLGLGYDWVDVLVNSGDCSTEKFLKMNRFGQVPVIELNDGRWLAQSNAILTFLALGCELYPSDNFEAGKVDEWLYWEQYSHEPYIAVSIFQMVFLSRTVEERETWRVERGEAALDLLNETLGQQDWLANAHFSIADISLFAYTARCHLGGFDLEDRPHIKVWLERVADELGLAHEDIYPQARV